MVMANDQLSGDKVHGGTISGFTSTGIDDNATANILTVSDATPLLIKKAGLTTAAQVFLKLENNAGGGVGAGSSINFHHYHAGGGPTGGEKAASITAQNMATWPGGTPSSYSTGLTFGTLHENTFDERVRISSAGYVGIGTTTPESFAVGPFVVGDGTTVQGMTIYTGTSHEGIIRFADGTSGAQQYEGQIKYDHSDNKMRFYTDHVERIRISSTGNVGIGTSTNVSDPVSRLNVRAATNHTTGSDREDLVTFHQGISAWHVGRGAGIRWVGDVSRTMAGISSYIFGVEQTGLAFETGGATSTGNLDPTTRMVIDHNGKVGIGILTPSSVLDVRGSLGANGTAATPTAYFVNNQSGATSGSIYIGASSGIDWKIGKNVTGISNNVNFSIADSSGNRRFDIDGSGNVGIGTTGPGYKLEVSGTAHVTNTLSAGALSIPSQGIILNQAFGTGVPSITMTGTANNGRAGAINFKESDGSGGAIADTAAIYSTDGLAGNANYGGLTLVAYQSDLRFSTGTLGDTKAIIKADGKVGIGTTEPDAKLHVNGTAIIGSNNNNATTPIAGLHVLDNNYSHWSTTLSKEQVALRVETYWNASGGQRQPGTYGGGIGFNHLGGHSLSHDENLHCWIGPRVVDTPAHERSALVFATNDDTSDEDAGILERASISPQGRFTFKQTSTNASQIHNSVGHNDLYKFSFSMSMMGNQAYVIRTSGHSNGIFKALAFGSHWTMTYGLYRESYISLDSATSFTEDNLHNRTSTYQGGITFSRHSSTEIDIVKSAGSYAGSMFFNVIMYAPRNVNIVGIY
jgi:hypothetical protein